MNSHGTTITKHRILELLDYVKDPEIPAINVLELGVVRSVEVEESGKAIITITPTYTGCPAMDVMAADIKKELLEAGVPEVEVKLTLSPAWTTDWITDEGKRKLKAYGIAPPEKSADIRALKWANNPWWPARNADRRTRSCSRSSVARPARRCGSARIVWSLSISSSAACSHIEEEMLIEVFAIRAAEFTGELDSEYARRSTHTGPFQQRDPRHAIPGILTPQGTEWILCDMQVLPQEVDHERTVDAFADRLITHHTNGGEGVCRSLSPGLRGMKGVNDHGLRRCDHSKEHQEYGA
jgi:phenylacetate-CoA oxygenase PaaJ subunit